MSTTKKTYPITVLVHKPTWQKLRMYAFSQSLPTTRVLVQVIRQEIKSKLGPDTNPIPIEKSNHQSTTTLLPRAAWVELKKAVIDREETLTTFLNRAIRRYLDTHTLMDKSEEGE